jgi:EmrB/QacA subfamily drug resistance transporter
MNMRLPSRATRLSLSVTPGGLLGQTAQIDTALDRNTRFALAAMALAIFVVANDFTSLSVALPAIERDFHVDVATVQWTVNAYALVFGVLTVTGGRVADLLGRRRVFVAGAVIFALCSALAALAPNVGVLIAARAAMAVGGAAMWPATLGLTYAALPEARRGLAGGLVLGVVGLGNAAGPLIGGALTDGPGWRYVLALNVPVAVLAVAVVRATVAETELEGGQQSFDWAGMSLLSGSLVALLFVLDKVSNWGWTDPTVVILLCVSALALLALLAVERRAGTSALIPADVAANGEFRAAVAAVLLMSMTFFTALVYLPQFMEKILGYSAVGAGIGLLPLMILFGASSFVAGRLYERIGPKRVILAGAIAMPTGMLLLCVVGVHRGIAVLIPGMAILGLGTGLFNSSTFTAAVSSLDSARASLASGIIYMFQVAGGSVGLGLATTIVASAAGSEAQAGGHAGSQFVHGLRDTFAVAGGLAVVGFVAAVVFVSRIAVPDRHPRPL